MYRRVSTAEQGDSRLGLEAQEAVICAERERRGWHAAAAYEDIATGKRIAGRPGLAAAIEHVRRTGGELHRISRDVIDFAILLRDAEKQG
jgi:DNA invertase Pin-like site-specific DNA recombinase